MQPLARVRSLLSPLACLASLLGVVLAVGLGWLLAVRWGDPASHFDVTEDRVLRAWVAQALAAGGLMLVLGLFERLRGQQLSQHHQREHDIERAHNDLQQALARQDAQLATVGHELRTPVNAILGLNGVLRQALQDHPDQVQKVEHIRGATVHLLQVVNDLLEGAQRQSPSAPTAQPPEDTLPEDATLRILVVDDNATNLMVARVQLQTCWPRADIVTLDSGAKALALLEQERFDLALVDMRMPEMDGLALARQIRRRCPTTKARMPIVAMTANTDPVDRQHGMDAGMDDVLHKPVDPQTLARCVSRHVLKARG